MIYSLLGFYLNWCVYNFFSEGHPWRWEVTLMCLFHMRLFGVVTPNKLALFAKPNSSLFITVGAKCDSSFVNEILRSLHFYTFFFSVTLLSAICWVLLPLSLITTSDAVVSSTYFNIWARSLMRTRNNHGPNFIPWGTPDGTEPHSE